MRNISVKVDVSIICDRCETLYQIEDDIINWDDTDGNPVIQYDWIDLILSDQGWQLDDEEVCPKCGES